MMDKSSVNIKQELDLDEASVTADVPSTSEIDIDEFKPFMDSTYKRTRGRPRIVCHERSMKVKTDEEKRAKKTGKRRGRPSKNNDVNPRSLICGICDFKAKNFYELEGHIRTHSNQSVFECPYCYSTFSQKGNLITHIRTHTKEKPFKCRICDFAASQKINLMVHTRVHTKEKPFKCSECDFSTAQKCNLDAHITRRHSNVEVVKTSEASENQWGCTDSHLKYYRCGMCMFSCRLKKQILEHRKLEHQLSACEYQTVDLLN